MPRSMGQKRAKEVKRKGNKVQDVAESMALVIQSMTESTQHFVKLMRKKNEEMDCSHKECLMCLMMVAAISTYLNSTFSYKEMRHGVWIVI